MDKWNPWKVTALAMALVMATALITGLVVANSSGSNREVAQPTSSPANARLGQQPRPASAKPATSQMQTAPVAPAGPTPEGSDPRCRNRSGPRGRLDQKTAGRTE